MTIIHTTIKSQKIYVSKRQRGEESVEFSLDFLDIVQLSIIFFHFVLCTVIIIIRFVVIIAFVFIVIYAFSIIAIITFIVIIIAITITIKFFCIIVFCIGSWIIVPGDNKNLLQPEDQGLGLGQDGSQSQVQYNKPEPNMNDDGSMLRTYLQYLHCHIYVLVFHFISCFA